MSEVVYRCICKKVVALVDDGQFVLKNKVVIFDDEMDKTFLICKGCDSRIDMQKVVNVLKAQPSKHVLLKVGKSAKCAKSEN